MSIHEVVLNLHGAPAMLPSRGEVEAFLDGVMDYLLTCEVVDPSVTEEHAEDGSHLRMEFSMSVEADQPDDAVVMAMSALRAAFHTMQAVIPGGEDLIAPMRSEIRAAEAGSDLIGA